MNTYTIELKKDQVLCREGDVETDIFIVLEGQLLVCVRKGSQVTAVATLGKGEYIGELSFFDLRPRGADIVALDHCKLVKIPATELRNDLPHWLLTMGKGLAKKLRLHDDVIRQKGVKKTNVGSIKPLSIEEQGHYFKLLSK